MILYTNVHAYSKPDLEGSIYHWSFDALYVAVFMIYNKHVNISGCCFQLISAVKYVASVLMCYRFQLKITRLFINLL